MGVGGCRVRGLYLLVTNEPSNHKEWAGGETKKGLERAGGGGGVGGLGGLGGAGSGEGEEEGYGSGKVVDHEKVKGKRINYMKRNVDRREVKLG